MKRPDLICWYREWDKSGKVVRELWRPIGGAETPAESPATPAEKPKIERGVRSTPEPEQDRLL